MPGPHEELQELAEHAEHLRDQSRVPLSGEALREWRVSRNELVFACVTRQPHISQAIPSILRGKFRIALTEIEKVQGEVDPGHATQYLDSLADILGAAASKAAPPPPVASTTTAVDRVRRVLLRFHAVQAQLAERQRGRPTLVSISDEWDVQDLLHGLLRIDFDDIRPETFAPEYAGGNSRVDFLLMPDQVVIETKFASASLARNEIGKQLIVDITRYKRLPDCKTLVCFVYDPAYRIANPAGLCRDLEQIGSDQGLPVVALVEPRR